MTCPVAKQRSGGTLKAQVATVEYNELYGHSWNKQAYIQVGVTFCLRKSIGKGKTGKRYLSMKTSMRRARLLRRETTPIYVTWRL